VLGMALLMISEIFFGNIMRAANGINTATLP